MASTGNQLVDALKELNANIIILQAKIDTLQSTMEKIESNTKPAAAAP